VDAIFDTSEKIGNCLVQHGNQNKRIYLKDYDDRDQNKIVDALLALAQKNEYGKIIAKVPRSSAEPFIAAGYAAEAQVLKYYQGREDCLFLSLFLSAKRKEAPDYDAIKNVLEEAKVKTYSPPAPLCEGYTLRELDAGVSGEMAALFKTVFATYPSPIFDSASLKEAMKDHTVFFGAFSGGKLVAVASGEMNRRFENAEMTDFAIHPDHRGQGLAKHLLAAAEEAMAQRGIKTLYTIARAGSAPMNCTFAGMGYRFGGTLINNTQIAGRIESMNVWYKNKRDG
jgi:putative beta-lysine N-acetyltransferase